ncbi:MULTISPECIES: hypothetical protein [Mesonia]|uniref:Uncharacterized protein n=1 Tax=Mesonia oceanica TaxID=2687242 RepID=A0AC61Y741_9FLAO|nr:MULTISPECIES: hypothetical protein [Mesonia]MAN26759.1 hypothetical protein [Mesonia sp.]MAQ40463.1 hypothetical protein [Mesonia sp.]MBJ98084.1 hypothetical protein [Flavobacteriaceae bacterium]VVV00301.1 hypothetical protein FVB9532_01570 [Mesonia oceanica]|tara:strand:- start:315 stop:656 length:342 start_codon:yes stop_codon:yes gene_type:complete
MDIKKDNKWIADCKKATTTIMSEMKEKLPDFKLIDQDLKRGTSFYVLIYGFNDLIIKIGGYRGDIEFELYINDNFISLRNEDDRFSELHTASENNFIIAINLIKKYLKANNHI